KQTCPGRALPITFASSSVRRNMATPHPAHVYKVVDGLAFAQAQTDGIFAGSEIDITDGYIHFSTALQLAETIRRHFRGRHDLVLASIRVSDLGDLRWEPSRGGELFPHLYGNLEMKAVEWVEGIDVDEDGMCVLPARIG